MDNQQEGAALRFLISGAGTLGQALAGLLAADGHRVDLVLRPRFCTALKTEGLTVTGIFSHYRAEPAQLELLEDLKGREGRDYDYVLLTTKTYNTAAALEALAGLPLSGGVPAKRLRQS